MKEYYKMGERLMQQQAEALLASDILEFATVPTEDTISA
jgi:hypothetical protein